MRLVVTTLAAILATIFGAAGSLYLAMWVGSLVSAHEPGAYIGIFFAIVAVPVGAVVAGWISAMFVWRAYGHSRPSA